MGLGCGEFSDPGWYAAFHQFSNWEDNTSRRSCENQVEINVDAATTLELWNKLKVLFDDSEFTRRVSLLHNLILTRLENCVSMQLYETQIVETEQKVTGIGSCISGEWIECVMLAASRNSFRWLWQWNIQVYKWRRTPSEKNLWTWKWKCVEMINPMKPVVQTLRKHGNIRKITICQRSKRKDVKRNKMSISTKWISNVIGANNQDI